MTVHISSPVAVETSGAVRRVGRREREAIALAGLTAALIAAFLMSLVLGSTQVPVARVMEVLLRSSAARDGAAIVVETIRLPRSLTALLAGAALGIAGLQMQTLFRNPLADPFALGISSGAGLGVAIVVLGSGMSVAAAFGASTGLAGDALLVGAAIAGAVAVLALVLVVSSRVGNPATVLILGLMFGYAASAVVTVLVGVSAPERLAQLAQWGFGSFSGVTWQRLRLFAPLTLVGVCLAGAMTKQLNALLLGESYARSMGVPVRTRESSDDARRLDAWRGRDGVLRADRISRHRRPSFVPRASRNIESSGARASRRPVGWVGRAGGPDRLAAARRRRHTAAERRDVDHRSASGGRRSPAKQARSVRRMRSANAPAAGAPAMTTRDLAVGYRSRRERRAVLERVNLAADSGELVCLLGPNGIGKSTLIRTLARMQPALWGSVELGGVALESLSASDLARRLAVVLTERVGVESLRARQVVELGRYPYSGWLGGLSGARSRCRLVGHRRGRRQSSGRSRLRPYLRWGATARDGRARPGSGADAARARRADRLSRRALARRADGTAPPADAHRSRWPSSYPRTISSSRCGRRMSSGS